jgi:hypothetical protein
MNFASAIHVGAGVEMAPGIYGELAYSFRNMGYIKTGNLKGFMFTNNVAASIRFNL